MSKTLLIVEESLRDLKAHWFEYIKHIATEAAQLGWRTQVACHSDVEVDIKKELDCLPVFKHARYLDSGKKKLPGEHYYGFVLHSGCAFHIQLAVAVAMLVVAFLSVYHLIIFVENVEIFACHPQLLLMMRFLLLPEII